jgi:hypothetical protein
LVVTSTSVVNVEVNDLDPGPLAMPWDQALPRSRQDDAEAWEATDFTFPSRYVEIPRPIQDYARPFLPDARSVRLSWSSCIASMATSRINRVQRP